jgi:hypothetical protein
MTSVTLFDLLGGISLGLFAGTAITASMMSLHSFFEANPVAHAFLNNTLVVLKSTEVVWRPAINASLVVLKPIVQLALMLFIQVSRALVLFLFTAAETGKICLQYIQSVSANLTLAAQGLYESTKDFFGSLATVLKGLGYLFAEMVHWASFVIGSFEQTATFFRRVLMEGHKVSWEDIYNVSVPFFVVASIFAFISWRAYKKFAKPVEKKEPKAPRRSSRLARKRALLYCADLPSASLSRKEASFAPNL